MAAILSRLIWNKHWKSRRIYVALGHDELTYCNIGITVHTAIPGQCGVYKPVTFDHGHSRDIKLSFLLSWRRT